MTEMLATASYEPAYVNACRARVALQIQAFEQLPAGPATTALEPHYFNGLLLALDAHFVHRVRGAEGKDGNPLNEVRMLVQALMSPKGLLAVDKTIKYEASKSVLGIAIGERVSLDVDDFRSIADAFFDELEHRFMA